MRSLIHFKKGSLKIYLVILLVLLGALCSCKSGKIEYRNEITTCLELSNSAIISNIQSGLINVDTTPSATDLLKPPVIEKPTIKNYISYDSLIKRYEDSIKLVFKELHQRQCYLINKSFDKKVSFTIKTIYDGEINSPDTEVYTLNPGEEVFLGCTHFFNSNNQIIARKFSIVGERKSR